MRGLLTFMLLAGIGGGLFVWQKHNEAKTTPAEMHSASQSQSKPALTPAPRGQASQHNWMKRALDRAADVRDQSRAQTKEAQDP
jgi:hypothetical protein